jgi:hypothetical protein
VTPLTFSVSGVTLLPGGALVLLGRHASPQAGAVAQGVVEPALAAGRPDLACEALEVVGTIDMFSTGRRDRLLDARRGAEAAGAVRLTAVLDLQLVAAHHMHGDLRAAGEASRRAVAQITALGIEPMRVIAPALSACPVALTADRDLVEAAIATIPAGTLDGDPDSRSSLWGTSRATCSLLREDRAAAVRELETAASVVAGAAEIRPQTW